MDGFKNSTKTQYSMGGSCYAKGGSVKGGSVKGAAKVAKVMGEFKSGDLHSGSKSGPKVTSRKQATAIAMSEARKAGAKMPQPVQKKSLGGILSAISPVAAIASGKPENLLTAFGGLNGLALQQLLKKKKDQQATPAAAPVAAKKGGMIKKGDGGAVQKKGNGGAMSPGATVARANRVSAEEAGEDRVIDRRRASTREPDYSKMKNYDAPSAPRVDTPLQQRLQRRGVPAHNATPMINRKSGGLAVMPRGKKC
jgi:hypothetical protein